MSGPKDETLLAFLDGTLDAESRAALLDALDRDEDLAARMRQAASGLDALRWIGDAADPVMAGPPAVPAPRTGISPWWLVAAAVVTLMVSVPATWRLSSLPATSASATMPARLGQPDAPEPSFVLVLRGRWPDAPAVDEDERARRAAEYWGWTSSLAESGVLVAAGDLRWEPGRELGPEGVERMLDASVVSQPDFLVGMLALRVNTYDEAAALARDCPHLRYGGSVSVRRVGSGFVAVDDRDDWSD